VDAIALRAACVEIHVRGVDNGVEAEAPGHEHLRQRAISCQALCNSQSRTEGNAMSTPPIRRVLVTLGAIAMTVVTTVGMAVQPASATEELDISFDGDGKRTIDLDLGGLDQARAVVVQPDGKILIAGQSNGTDFSVLRLSSNGSNDTSFDSDGEVGVNFGGFDFGNDLALQPDGRIVIVGQAGLNSAIGVTRLSGSGQPDSSFDGDGQRTLSEGDTARAVVVQPDGKIVMAGTGKFSNQFDMRIQRLNADGSDDWMRAVNFGGFETAVDVALQPDGKIVVVGNVPGTPQGDWAVVRLTSAGQLDATFAPGGVDGDGKRTIDHGGEEEAGGLVVQPDGKILIAGIGNGSHDFAFHRMNSDGSNDTSFDGDGAIGIDFGDVATLEDLALQPDGKIVAVGSVPGTDRDFGLMRLKPDGSPDASFGPDGQRRIDVGGADTGEAVAMQPDGKIVVVGSTPGPGGSDVAVARFAGTVQCQGRNVTIAGTEGDDWLEGTAGPDVIAGFGSDDTIEGFGGDDVICGGDQQDGIDGGEGNDSLDGGLHADDIFGGPGTDTLTYASRTTPVTVTFDNGPNDGASNDADNVRTDVENVVGGTGNDRLFGSSAANRMYGGPGVDSIFGGNGADYLSGDDGNDTLVGGNGGDLVSGGRGVDTVSYSDHAAGVVVTIGDGKANDGNAFDDARTDNVGATVENVRGSQGNDSITGNSLANQLFGLLGNDTLRGAGGNDRLSGDSGNDSLFGSIGNDKLYGYAGSDRLYGYAGNDYLNAGTGADSMYGQAGRDTLHAKDGTRDSVINCGTGTDPNPIRDAGDPKPVACP